MKYHEILTEAYINVFTKKEKQQYKDVVWDMLIQSYANIGGYGGASSIDELIAKSHLWKMVKRDGKIVAISIYKDQHGRKAIAMAQDGSQLGKNEVKKIIQDDIVQNRAWAEVSGAMEALNIKYGGKPIPNKYAEVLTGKEILSYNPDGYHYTRLIGGKPHEKIIIGTPHPVTFDDKDKMTILQILS